jgi:hypothetical protein
MNTGAIAALAGLAGGLGFLWWKKRQAAPAPSGGMNSTCVSLCVAAAKQGAGPALTATKAAEIEATCKAGCGLVEKFGADGAKLIHSGWSSLVYGSDRPVLSASSCPEGSQMQMMNRSLSDHRVMENGSQGTVCVDKTTGIVLGSLDTAGFHPWTPSASTYTAPKPVSPMPMPTSTTSIGTKVTTTAIAPTSNPVGTSGGVAVTVSTTSTRNTTTATSACTTCKTKYAYLGATMAASICKAACS